MFGTDGWVAVLPHSDAEDGPDWMSVMRSDADLISWLYLRFAKLPSGRLLPVEMFLTNLSGINTTLLGELGLRQLEVWANTPDVRDQITAVSLDEIDPSLAMLHFSRPAPTTPEHWPPPGRLVADAGPKPALKLAGVNSTGKRPDAFYQAVAVAYRWLAHNSSKPTTALAEANHVPRSTAVGWIRIARSRGFLQPGQSGKAG